MDLSFKYPNTPVQTTTTPAKTTTTPVRTTTTPVQTTPTPNESLKEKCKNKNCDVNKGDYDQPVIQRKNVTISLDINYLVEII